MDIKFKIEYVWTKIVSRELFRIEEVEIRKWRENIVWTQTDSQSKIFCPVVSLESRRWIIRKYVIGHKIGHKLENEHL